MKSVLPFRDLFRTGRRAWLIALALIAFGAERAGAQFQAISTVEFLVFRPSTTLTQSTMSFVTEIRGLLNGALVFERTFAEPFASSNVQGGVTAARIAITGAGGPGVVISGPTLVSRSETVTTSSTSLFSAAGVSGPLIPFITPVTGPAETRVGFLNDCRSSVAALPSSTRPTCVPLPGQTLTVSAGSTVLIARQEIDFFIDEAVTTTNNTQVTERYELNGAVQPVGAIHTAMQSGLFDLAGRLLRRLGDEGSAGLFGEPATRAVGTTFAADLPADAAPVAPAPLPIFHQGRGWAEAYGIRARTDAWREVPGDRRDAHGFAGGVSYVPVPWLMLGFGIDQGRVDVVVPAAVERANIDLTQVASVARISNGPFALALSATYGFGSVDTTRAFLAVSSASYDVRLWGVLAEASYRFDLGPWHVVPKAGADYVRVEGDRFSEIGLLGLIARPTDTNRSRAFAGIEVGRAFAIGEVAWLDLSSSIRAVTVLDGAERTLPVAFAAAPNIGLTIRGNEARGTGIDLGAQARLGVTPNIGLYAAYNGQFHSHHRSHAATAGLKVVW